MSTWIPTPQSSNLAAFLYDDATQVLTVEFKNGIRYDYFDVPRHIAEGLETASSKGKYLNSQVKGTYRYARQ